MVSSSSEILSLPFIFCFKLSIKLENALSSINNKDIICGGKKIRGLKCVNV